MSKELKMFDLDEFNLDEIYEFFKISKRHADRAYVLRNKNIIILIEETSRAKNEDIDKLVETIQTVREDERFLNIFQLKDTLGKIKFILTLHARKGLRSELAKHLAYKSRKLKATPLTASCDKDFRNKLRSLEILK